MISFVNPAALILLLLIPFAVVFLYWRGIAYWQRLQLINPKLTVTEYRYWMRSVLWLVICTLLIIALARPVWGTELEALETQGVSIMFVLDVSKSMDAEDVSPSRIERAKLSLEDLFRQLSGNELGLVLFAANPMVQFPLTTDTLSATSLIKHITTGSISAQGTNIADAIRLANQALSIASKGKHLIVLMTDGEGHEGDIDSAVEEAAQAGITIYTIGYGDSAGALIPVRNPDGSISDKRDATGNQVYSALDEKTLNTIAASTEGTYERAFANGNEIRNLLHAVNQYTPNTLNRGVQVTDIERFDIFVALSVLLWTVDLILSRLEK